MVGSSDGVVRFVGGVFTTPMRSQGILGGGLTMDLLMFHAALQYFAS
jgi:hypothetical protein